MATMSGRPETPEPTSRFRIVKNTRVETNETPSGRIRERTVTTYDVVSEGRLLSEWTRKRDAEVEIRRLSGEVR